MFVVLGVVQELECVPGPVPHLPHVVQEAQPHVVVGQRTVVLTFNLRVAGNTKLFYGMRHVIIRMDIV
jgi:hypothetical protein